MPASVAAHVVTRCVAATTMLLIHQGVSGPDCSVITEGFDLQFTAAFDVGRRGNMPHSMTDPRAQIYVDEERDISGNPLGKRDVHCPIILRTFRSCGQI